MPPEICSHAFRRKASFGFFMALGILFLGICQVSAQLVTESWGWTYQTGGNVYSSPAVDSNGNIYVGSGDNKLYALESNGTLKWTFMGATDWIDTSPAIGSDGTIYVGSWDNKLYAINPTDGSKAWEFATYSAITSSPAIGADGTIYFGSNDYFFYALESNGTEKWSYFAGDEINSSPAIGADGTIYFGDDNGSIHALNEDGSLKWSYEVPNSVTDVNNTILSSPALDLSGNVYFGCSNGFFYSIADNDTSASLNWSYETDDAIDSSPVFGPEGNLYFISRDGYLRALDPSSGIESWNVETGDVFYSTPVVDSQGYVYVAAYAGSGNNAIYAYESNSSVSTSKSMVVGGVVDSSLTLTDNGYLLFGCFDDKLYAVDMSNPLADSDWPKFKRNLAADGRWPSYHVDANASPSEGGSVSGGGTFSEGASVSLTASASTGYDFTSWSGDASGTSNPYPFSPLTANKSVTAIFTIRQYALSLTAGTGGAVSGDGTYEHGTPVSITATPGTGYYFTGWTGATVADSSSTSTIITLTQAESLTANFALNEYLLVVTSGTGGAATGDGNFTHGTSASIAATPTTGYHFANWTGDGVADENAASTTVTMDQNRSVTANFAIDQHVLTLNAGSGGSVSGEGTFDYGTNASVSANPDTGYHFDYWTGSGATSTTEASTTVTMTADRNVSAIFALNEYTLTLSAGAGGSVTGDGNYTYGTGASITATADSNYHFVSWSGAGVADAGSTSTTVTIDQNRSVTASFAIDEHTLTVNTGTGGSVSGDGNFTYGTNASITATPDTGYHFVTWTGAGAADPASAATTVSMTTDRTVTASFALDQHVLTVEANSSGSVTGSGTYDYGETVTITATPDTGHQFSNWSGATVADSNSASTTITLTADANVTANFEADVHELILNVGSGGSVSGDGNYTYGTNASITATPDSGYYFIGWSGDGVADANSSSTTAAMTEDRNLTASFAQVPPSEYVVQTFAEPVGAGSTGGGGTYVENSSVPLTATPGAGYQFLGWSVSGGTLSSPLSDTSASVTLDQSSDANATAHFDALSYGLVLEASTGGSVSGDGNYSLGESVAIAATSENGYSFAGWEVNGTLDFAVTAAARQYDGSSNALYLDGKESPPLTLVRGVVYQFVLDGSTTAGHPFYFSSDSSGGGNSYLGEITIGVTNSRAESGTVTISVDDNTSSTLYYYCGNHSGMGNLITVIDSSGLLADTSSTTATISASYALRANWSLNQHLLTVNAGSGGSVTGGGTFDYGTDASIVAIPEVGRVFTNWSGNGVDDANLSSTTVSMTEDRILTANFEVGSYTLVVSGDPIEGGSAIGGGSFAHGDTATIAATPVTGYVFSSWSGSGITDPNARSTTVTVTSSQTITANFAPSTHLLTLLSSPLEAGAPTGDGTYEYASSATIIASPATGYVFSSWSGSGITESNASTTTVSMTEDRNVTANFELASYDLSVAVDASGGGSVAGGGSFSHGQGAAIAATASTGYVFVGWSGSGITDATASSTTVTVSASQTVTASFAKAIYSITLQSDPVDSGTFSGAGTYEYGATAELNATTAHGYSFSHWSGIFLTEYNASSISLTVTQDLTLTAHFVAHSDSGELYYELNATELDAGWKASGWFGFFHQTHDHWAYHYDFGWIYVDEVTEDGFWYWHEILGWLWTKGDVYPAVWSKGTGDWIRFSWLDEKSALEKQENRLWYYDYPSEQWLLALPSFVVTAIPSPSNGGSVSGAASYVEGSTATLTATAASGYEFSGWSGGASGTSLTLNLTVNSDLEVTATFTRVTTTTTEQSDPSSVSEAVNSIFGR